MTEYEIITVVLSALAILLSILIPLVQWIWKKWITRANVKFYPVGFATLMFNQSGSYLQLNGVIESEKKAVSIRKMRVRLTRKKDNRTLNLTWSHLISPVNQRLVGNIMQTTECAHPFRVDGDSIMTTFIEYTDPFDSFGKTFRTNTSKLFEEADRLPILQSDYSSAAKSYSAAKEYSEVKQILKDEFYWLVGQYCLDVIVDYNNSKKVFSYEFSISENDYNDLSQNIDESLLAPLKNNYQRKWDFRSALVEISERKA